MSLWTHTQSNYQLKNIGSFHGTGAFNLTKFSEWDSVLTDMLEKPAEVVIVYTRRRGRGRRQGSRKKNPYLQEVRALSFIRGGMGVSRKMLCCLLRLSRELWQCVLEGEDEWRPRACEHATFFFADTLF